MIKGLFVLLFTIFSIDTYALGTSFLVAPTSAEVDLKKPNTVSFVVVNNGENRIRVSANPIYFPAGSKFMPPMQSISTEKDDYDDLSKYMVVSPKVVSLKAGERRTVRVSIRPNSELTDGEYRAHVLFSTLDIERPASAKKNKKANEGLNMSLSFKTETGVVVYGSKGSGASKMEAKCHLLKDKTKMEIINSGLWRFDGWLTVYDPNNAKKKMIEEKVFLTRQSKKELLLNWVPSADQKNIKIDWVPLDTKLKKTTSICNVS